MKGSIELEWLRAAIREAEEADGEKFNRKRVAANAGISDGYFSQLINGHRGSAVQHLFAVARAYDSDLGAMLVRGRELSEGADTEEDVGDPPPRASPVPQDLEELIARLLAASPAFSNLLVDFCIKLMPAAEMIPTDSAPAVKSESSPGGAGGEQNLRARAT